MPWVVMRAMRDRVVHVYFDLDPDILWDTVHNDLPRLVNPVRRMLACCCFLSGSPWLYTCQNTTMAELATNLPQWAGAYVDHPFADATGLAGGWNFTLSWTPRQAFENPARPADAGGAVASDPTGGVTIFEALEKQLGLRVQKGTHEIPVTVVDHLEERPSDY